MKVTRVRILIIYLVMLICLLMVVLRIGYLKLAKHNEFYQKAIDLWTRSAPIKAERGKIYDRFGRLIVGNYLTPTIVCIPYQVKDKEKTSELIANILDADPSLVFKHLKKQVSLEIIKPVGQKISVEKAIEIMKLGIEGIYVVGDSSRYYPHGNVLAQVVGICGIDNQGLTGIELMYDDFLKGENGAMQIFTDAKGEKMEDLTSLFDNPKKGSDVYLTIDLDIQLTLEKVLANAIENYTPEESSGLILNAKTAEVLAMASFPTFDPANYKAYSEKLYNRNIPIWKTYEPGSTFKYMTFSAGIEEKIFKLDDYFYDPGFSLVDGERIKDWKKGGHGRETFLEVLQNSCNPGFVDIGLKLGKDRFFNYLKKYGFGEKTGIDLIGEAKGIIFNKEKIGNVELATSAFGQGNTVTMIQLVNGMIACINGGELLKPFILKKIVCENKIILEKEKTIIRKVISNATSEKMRYALESVVAKGTGRAAFIEGFRVGGKTGTAQIPKDGVYVSGRYILSFLGAAPMDSPEIVAMIALESPKNCIQYGGVVVAPMVKEVIMESFAILKLEKRKNEIPFSPRLWIDKALVEVKNYVGQEVGKIKHEVSYQIKIEGTGKTVLNQVPAYGDVIREGGYVVLYT